MASKSPTLLTNVQRARLTHIPTDMTDREIGQYYTFTPSDLTIIRRHRGPQNWLGFAVQLAVLRFPGRPLTDLDSIPTRVLAYLAQQVGVAPDVLSDYGTRPATLSDHLEEIRSTFGYRDYDWRAIRWLMNHLVPMAMHGTRPLPLIEAALHLLRTQMVIAPAIRSLERGVWRSLRLVERRAYRVLSRSLSGEQQTALDGMLTSAPSPGRARGSTRLTWLRKAPGNPSANQIQEIVARLTVLDTLNLPPFPSQIPRPQGLRLARQGATYQPQALAAFPPEKRYALLYAHLWDLQAERGDQAVDMFDAVLTELMRKGEHHQQTHITTHGRAMNTHLRLLAQILEVFRTAQQAGRDPAVAVLSILPEAAMDEVLEDLRHLLRPDDFDYLDLIETRYVKLRSSLFAFYRTMTFHPLHHRDPALDALNHVQTLAQHRQRVTAIKQTIGDQTYLAPLDHLRERWRLITLNNFIARQELTRLWGDGTQSSSDGLRVRLGVQSAQAAFHANHANGERGATFYLQTMDFWSPHGHKVIKANDREALHVLDLLYYQATPFQVDTHYTDTAGSTDILFGLSDLLGFRFCPRLADVLSRQFFTVGPPDDYGPLNALIKGRINPDPIRTYWSDIRWIAASIGAGTAPPSVILRKLHQTHPRQNRIGRALMEQGKLPRTKHQIEYVRDVVFRHSVQTALNKGEAINGLGRTLFLGQRGILRERAYQDQLHRVSCLAVLMAMVSAWNTVYLTAAIPLLRAMGVSVPEELLAHISPTGWSHINILGQYTFEPESWLLDHLRPLRTQDALDTDGPDGDDDFD